jgi:alpha-aminoadipate carrier protein LysW
MTKVKQPVTCKDCGEAIFLDKNLEVGEIIECQNCGAEMEVVNLEPLEVSLIEEEK